MKICGIVSEYNPFHTGHLYHVNKTISDTNCTHIVAVMSGNFVQRGECALFDKHTRAKWAVENGVNLVLELPTVHSTLSAEGFAFGSVSLINALNCVDILSFGSECEDITKLYETALLLNNEENSKSLKDIMNTGIAFHSAMRKIINIDLLDKPNNILAVQYLNALLKLGSKIQPHVVKRIGASINDSSPSQGFCGATLLREYYRNNHIDEFCKFVPSYENETSYDMKNAEGAILAMLRKADKKDISKILDVSEGLENKISEAAFKANSLLELYALIKSKRYVMARIKRIILRAYLGTPMPPKKPLYIKVLAFDDKGREIINKIKTSSKLPVITKPSNINKLSKAAQKMLMFENKASSLYNLMADEKVPFKSEFEISPVYLRK